MEAGDASIGVRRVYEGGMTMLVHNALSAGKSNLCTETWDLCILKTRTMDEEESNYERKTKPPLLVETSSRMLLLD